MNKNESTPQEEYLTIGETAKKLGVTVRTLQYYDREGLLSPSAKSAGGRRLYTNKDLISLYQILSLKHLRFSLEDIKTRLIPLNTPDDVAKILTEQAVNLREQIKGLTQALREVELLKEEVLQMQSVNFKKYADIITNLQMNNEFYPMIKHFDDQTLEHIRKRFNQESGHVFIERFNLVYDEIMRLQRNNVPPDSEQAQAAAASFWQMIMEFTNGNTDMLQKLMEMGSSDFSDSAQTQRLSLANAYISPALDIYFTKLRINPSEENQNA